ncbi:MAG: hypothetical protein J5615_07865 [Fibrobacter sp.]|nr:hypothetical protein [Fibrobacter sp.]
MTTSIPMNTLISSSADRYCDICGGVAKITVNRDHFCGECLQARRVRAFLLGRASK